MYKLSHIKCLADVTRQTSPPLLFLCAIVCIAPTVCVFTCKVLCNKTGNWLVLWAETEIKLPLDTTHTPVLLRFFFSILFFLSLLLKMVLCILSSMSMCCWLCCDSCCLTHWLYINLLWKPISQTFCYPKPVILSLCVAQLVSDLLKVV